jgi:bifunctional non-homologous end joining protein LigD
MTDALPIPAFVPCQLAATASKVPAGDQWIFEPKFDGYRCQLALGQGGARFFTRSGLDWTERFKSAAPEQILRPAQGALIDGELCVLNPDGRPDFSLLARGLGSGDASLVFCGFDLLVYQGRPIHDQPLLDRKLLLNQIIQALACGHIRYVEHSAAGAGLLADMVARNWEGVMAKDAHAAYQPGQRSSSWRKLKCKHREEFVIAGWRPDPTTGHVRSLVLAAYEDGTLVPRGSVGSGLTCEDRKKLPFLLPKRATPPFVTRPSGYPDIVWTEPTIMAAVEFQEITPNGSVRSPRYVGLRKNSEPGRVRRNVCSAPGRER